MTTIPATTPRPNRRPAASKPHGAGVLAHGLHALGLHIATYKPSLLTIDVTPAAARHGLPAITVLLLPEHVDAWLDSVHVDEHQLQQDSRGCGLSYSSWRVRLADTGVVVGLRCTNLPDHPLVAVAQGSEVSA